MPGPIQVIIPLTPALMPKRSLPTILYLCRELSLLTHSILHLSLLNHIQVFQVTSLVQQSNFEFWSCLPGHLQPSHLSQCPNTNRNFDQIPSRPQSCEHCTQLCADSSGYSYSAGSYQLLPTLYRSFALLENQNITVGNGKVFLRSRLMTSVSFLSTRSIILLQKEIRLVQHDFFGTNQC